MRSREDGVKKPCRYCSALTLFEWERVGPRGGKTVEPVCISCGERPSLLNKAAA